MNTFTPAQISIINTVIESLQKQLAINVDVQITFAGYFPITLPAPVVVPVQATVMCPPNGANAMTWDPKASGIMLENTIFDSADGKGFIGNVQGDKVTIHNVDFKNLNEGLHYTGCTNLTIIGGGQVGNVLGRCHLFEDVQGLRWSGDPTKKLGHASTQSPIRFDSPGVRNGTIIDVHATQVGSSFPIACWAIHAANAVNFVDCVSEGGEFSFNSAGAGVGDAVTNCTVTNLTVINSKLSLSPIASNNHFVGGKFTNPTGECVSLSCGPGNVFDGLELHTGSSHGFKLYSPSDAIIKNCTVYGPAGCKIIDGGTPANDGGGNRLVATP